MVLQKTYKVDLFSPKELLKMGLIEPEPSSIIYYGANPPFLDIYMPLDIAVKYFSSLHNRSYATSVWIDDNVVCHIQYDARFTFATTQSLLQFCETINSESLFWLVMSNLNDFKFNEE